LLTGRVARLFLCNEGPWHSYICRCLHCIRVYFHLPTDVALLRSPETRNTEHARKPPREKTVKPHACLRRKIHPVSNNAGRDTAPAISLDHSSNPHSTNWTLPFQHAVTQWTCQTS